MSTPDAARRYSGPSLALHWLTLLLLAAVYTCGELREDYPEGSDMRRLLKTRHFMLGLGVLVPGLPRLALRRMPSARRRDGAR
ncbi:hypothetical protein [Solimonas soli]|uniref:hypothetical protein n=1 Tax=Solimonas soli TaxID=413479 RepID=UPI0004B7B957|nr:hypothetical protein [Solimonas soli]